MTKPPRWHRRPSNKPPKPLKTPPLAGEPPKFTARVALTKQPAKFHARIKLVGAKVQRSALRDWSGTKRLSAK